MTYAASLLLITGIYLAVLASPGPNFFILSQMALDGRHREARYAVYGLTTGSIFWVLVSMAGLATLLSQHPWLASALRYIGAAYLMWYGARLLWSAFSPSVAREVNAQAFDRGGKPLTAYRTGLLTGMTNPKGAAFWTSAFAAVFPAAAPFWFYALTVLLVAALSLGWHLGITLIFGTPTLRGFYLRIERGVNGVAGGVLVTLGLQRLLSR
ncbi:MAG: LysE family transporter [Pseudomonas sp.]|uniref:LysE family transporter n=1 Tax=Pseudomonas sp. TaxID=306 RepID=UPI0030F0999F